MKLLACASYDYMKLMVLELQQQLAELEESERLAASSTTATTTLTATTNGLSSSTVEEGGTEPKPPPRQRANPFNQLEPQKLPKKTWLKMHQEYGLKIQKDRTVWCQIRRDLLQEEKGS